MARPERVRRGRKSRREAASADGPPTPYHHGALRQALLGAAETILRRDGITGLTLRAAAREAGVSHAAPKNHFGDIKGLQSELAAAGFSRLAAAMQSALARARSPDAAMDAIGRAYVRFARDNPGMFMLMYRGEMLDFGRPALREAASSLFVLLRGTVARRRGEASEGPPSLEQLAGITAAWSMVHGFAMLAIDRRLQPILARVDAPDPESALLEAMLRSVKPGRASTSSD